MNAYTPDPRGRKLEAPAHLGRSQSVRRAYPYLQSKTNDLPDNLLSWTLLVMGMADLLFFNLFMDSAVLLVGLLVDFLLGTDLFFAGLFIKVMNAAGLSIVAVIAVALGALNLYLRGALREPEISPKNQALLRELKGIVVVAAASLLCVVLLGWIILVLLISSW